VFVHQPGKRFDLEAGEVLSRPILERGVRRSPRWRFGLVQRLADDFPAKPYRFARARGLHHLILLYKYSGRLPEAVKTSRQAAQLLQGAVDEDPTQRYFLPEPAKSQTTLGVLLRDAGRHQEARELFRAALARRDQLNTGDPNEEAERRAGRPGRRCAEGHPLTSRRMPARL